MTTRSPDEWRELARRLSSIVRNPLETEDRRRKAGEILTMVPSNYKVEEDGTVDPDWFTGLDYTTDWEGII